MKTNGIGLAAFIVFNFLFPSQATCAEEPSPYEIMIQDHRFSPASLMIPAGEKVKIIVRNEDATPEEFESYALNREKVVAGHSKIALFVGPLKPGTYEYFGDFHPDTARGVIEAR